jgi:hypothetical protein
MIKFFLMGIVVIVAAIGLGLGIQHVMALGDCYDCNFTGRVAENITIIVTAVMVQIAGITTALFFC